MGAIIQFKPELRKFGYQPVKKSKRVDLERHGQLNLFNSPAREARVIQMKSDYSPFEQGLLLDERGDAQAKQMYQKAIAEQDYVADAYCNLGILESKEGDTLSAIDCFSNSLKHEPRHFESHFNLANVYFDTGNLKLAKLHYEMAAKIQADYPNVYFNLALACAMLEDFEQAVTALKKYKSLSNVSEHKNADTLLNNLQLSLSANRLIR